MKKEFELKKDWQTVKRLWKWIKPYWPKFIWAIIAGAFYAAFNLAQVKLVQPLVNGIFLEKNIHVLKYFPFLIVGIYLGKCVSNYANIYLIAYIGQSFVRDIRDTLFGRFLQLPLDFFQKNRTGTLMSRITNDVNQMQQGVSKAFGVVVLNVLTIAALLLNLIFKFWKLSAIAVIVIPVSVFPILQFAKKLRRASRLSQEKMADLNSTLFETFFGIIIVKAFNTESAALKKFRRFNRDYYNNIMKAVRADAAAPQLMEFIGAVGAAIIVGTGGYFIVHNQITPGEFSEFIVALFLLYTPIKIISKSNYMIQKALAASDRVFNVLDTRDKIVEKSDAQELKSIDDSIEFQDVTFKYDEKPVLENINLEIPKGQILAIVGSSGAGKTTLVNLLPRFFDVSHGAVLIDGKDIRDLTLKSLRQNIGIVTQDTILFNDTVKNNIAYGQKEPDIEKVVQAAEASYANEFIKKLPHQYETFIGERGLNLSGGEKQRIAIARAILKNPPILILDEATSALDTESEEIIQRALGNLMQNRTVFVIAHRLSTIRNAGKIIVLKNGKIVEQGVHEELMALNREYKKLHDLQFKNQNSIPDVNP